MKVFALRAISDHGTQYRIGQEIEGWDAEKILAFAAKNLVRVEMDTAHTVETHTFVQPPKPRRRKGKGA